MKCNKCGYDWSNSGDSAHVCGPVNFPSVKAAKEEVKQHVKYYNEMMGEPTTYERVIECAKRLVEHADFKLGGALSADSKAKDIPSKAVSQVKSRHLAALRDALAAHGIKE